ncbi:hypothetical protein M0R45_026047 [Rubus argutus]|uniref:Uncharacterized protein n=1 Tax=Rubus argutus TaxID=59490 RepID=A0AAW1WX22_RUBAR
MSVLHQQTIPSQFTATDPFIPSGNQRDRALYSLAPSAVTPRSVMRSSDHAMMSSIILRSLHHFRSPNYDLLCA